MVMILLIYTHSISWFKTTATVPASCPTLNIQANGVWVPSAMQLASHAYWCNLMKNWKNVAHILHTTLDTSDMMF